MVKAYYCSHPQFGCLYPTKSQVGWGDPHAYWVNGAFLWGLGLIMAEAHIASD